MNIYSNIFIYLYLSYIYITQNHTTKTLIISSSSHTKTHNQSPQVFIKVFSEDESSKTVAVDNGTTVRDLCDLLIKKYRHPPSKAWSLVEHWSDLQMGMSFWERVLFVLIICDCYLCF